MNEHVKRMAYLLTTLVITVFLIIPDSTQAQDSERRPSMKESVQVARAAVDWVRDNHFVMESPQGTRRIDRQAFAVIEPDENPQYAETAPDAMMHHRSTAEGLDKPFGHWEDFLNCTSESPDSPIRKCSFEKGVESLFRFENLSVNDDSATIDVVWSFIVNEELANHRYRLAVERTGRTWEVTKVLRRELQ